MDRYDWKSLSSMAVSICHTSALTEPIAWFSSSSRLSERGEESEMTPAELQERTEVWKEKLLFSETPRYFFNPTTRARKLVHPDHVHGQTLWQAEKAFDKPWKSSYNFSTRLSTSIPLLILSCAMTMKSVEFTTRRASYERLILLAFVPVLWNTQNIQLHRATVLSLFVIFLGILYFY